ncbi:TPA: hypothetical protein RTI63_001309 [Campylobacter coli]|nr:hypothetical protein [Campylobacter coli]
MNLSFKTFDLSSKERQKAKKVQGKKYEFFLMKIPKHIMLLKCLLGKF